MSANVDDDDRLKPYSLRTLRERSLPPLKFVVPGLVPAVGLTVIAGKAKLGKSWLVYDLLLAAEVGGTALGRNVTKCKTLYYALEDNDRRMKERATQLLGANVDDWPDVAIAHLLGTLDTSGPYMIEKAVKALRENDPDLPVLVTLDCLAKVRGRKLQNETPYDYDYRIVGKLHALAHTLGIAIVLVHHTRKQSAEDVLDEISGTMGIAGAADTLIVVSKSKGQRRLYARGRDIAEVSWLMEFAGCRWKVLGEFDEGDETEPEEVLSETRRAILDVLVKVGQPMKPKAITQRLLGGEVDEDAREFARKHNVVKQLLGKMARETNGGGPFVVKIDYGTYVGVEARADAVRWMEDVTVH